MTEITARLSTARYAIEHELGAGGMATVYLAEDLKHKRKVAVKVLRPDPCDAPIAPFGSIPPWIAPCGGSSHVLRGVGGGGPARNPPDLLTLG